MNLYHLPATGSVDEESGVHPDFSGTAVIPGSWSGVYDVASHSYVVATEEDLVGLTPMTEGEDVGFPYQVPRENTASPETTP